MLLLGTRNTSSQTVLANGVISLGSVYRRYCRKNACGIPAFSFDGMTVTLNQSGIYHVTATLVGAGTVAGDVSVQMRENGVAIPGAISTETITTAATEQRTFVIDTYVLVDDSTVLCTRSTNAKAISLLNAGVGATFTAVAVNVDKVV